MGVGRNLIYRKSLFEKTGGFQKHAHLASGDDDLFINAVAHKSNTALILEPTAFVFSKAKAVGQATTIKKFDISLQEVGTNCNTNCFLVRFQRAILHFMPVCSSCFSTTAIR